MKTLTIILLLISGSLFGQTTVYNDYYSAYDNGLFDIRNVNFNVKLVSEDYVPDPSHKPADVKKYIITSLGALKGNVIATKSMGEIIELMKEKTKKDIEENKETAIANVEAIFADRPEKLEKLKQNIEMEDGNDWNWWETLKENGIKYFVIESPNLKILCFCEELQ